MSFSPPAAAFREHGLHGQSDLIARLLDDVPNRPASLTSKHRRIDEDSYPDDVILVRESHAIKFRVTGSGRRQILGFASPGDFLVPFHGARPFSIAALETCQFALFPADAFDAYLAASDEMTRHLRAQMSRDLLISQEWLLSLGSSLAEDRVIRLICELGARMRLVAEPFPLRQREIADATGQTAVNVNRVLANLDKSGLITRNGRFVVNDWAGLRRMIGFDGRYLECKAI